MKYLLDTCVISELVARRPNADVVRWLDGVDEERLYLSVITIGEIKKGIDMLPSSRRQRGLAEWLAEDLLLRFQDRILPVDTAVMLVWGELAAALEVQGRRMPAMNSLVAAIALRHQIRLATRNVRDFAGSGVDVFNPWQG